MAIAGGGGAAAKAKKAKKAAKVKLAKAKKAKKKRLRRQSSIPPGKSSSISPTGSRGRGTSNSPNGFDLSPEISEAAVARRAEFLNDGSALKRMREDFAALDVDSDGFLTMDEIVEGLSRIYGRDLNSKEVQAVLIQSGVKMLSERQQETEMRAHMMKDAVGASLRRISIVGTPTSSSSVAPDGDAAKCDDDGAANSAAAAAMVDGVDGAGETPAAAAAAAAAAAVAEIAAAGDAAPLARALTPPWRVSSADQKRLFSFEHFTAVHDSLIGSKGTHSITAKLKHTVTRMIHPCEPFKQQWDKVLATVLIYSLLIIPYRTCLNIPAEANTFMWWVDLGVDVYFLVDICLTFRTGYIDKDGVFITNPCRVAVEYLKLWFWIDLFTSLPITTFLELALDAGGTAAIAASGNASAVASIAAGGIVIPAGVLRIPRMVRFVRILRLLKLVRLAKLAKLMSSWQNRQSAASKIGRFAKLIGFIFFLAHMCGCLYAMMGGLGVWQIEVDEKTLRTRVGKGWLRDDELTGYEYEDEMDKNWIYLLSLYWAVTTLTTVGYGDITPTTSEEVAWTIFIMFVGTCAFGYIVGSVTAVLMDEDRVHTMIREKIDEISSYMRSRGLSRPLQERVREYFDFVWQTNTIFDEHTLLEELPSFLRDEVVNEAYGDLVDAVPMLQDLAPSELTSLMMRLNPLRVLPSQVIVRRGELGTEMYIVSGGLLRTYFEPDYPHEESFLMDVREMIRAGNVLLPGQKPARGERPSEAFGRPDLLGRGDYFGHYCIIGGGDEDGDGEIDIIGDEEEEINARHPYTVVAVQMSMLLSLSRPDFEDAKMLFPNLAFQLAQNSKKKQSRTNLRDQLKAHIRTTLEMTDIAVELDGEEWSKPFTELGLNSIDLTRLRGWILHEMDVTLPESMFNSLDLNLADLADAIEARQVEQELLKEYESSKEPSWKDESRSMSQFELPRALSPMLEEESAATPTVVVAAAAPAAATARAATATATAGVGALTASLAGLSKDELIQLSLAAMKLAADDRR